MNARINRFWLIRPNRKGQGMVEYGLILGLVALVVILALAALGTNVFGWFTVFTTAVNSASGGG